ncbi:MAG: hypothetical protein IT261_02565 [Saprospiraceae bacterium]|nr:hypothetical protein [Saprospiraceae bacterium]
MTKNIHLVGFMLLMAVSLSSCITIIEEITIRKDGSGSYRLALDASKVKDMFGDMGNSLESKLELDTTVAIEAPDSVGTIVQEEKKYDMTARLLAEKRGISNSKGFNDTITLQSGYAFDFASLADMQDALLSLEDGEGFGLWNEGASIAMSGKKLKRRYGSSNFSDFLMEVMDKEGEEDKDKNAVQGMFKMMFRDLEFKTVYHFPDQKIKKCNLKGAEISSDRHFLTIMEMPMEEKKKSVKKPDELVVRFK